MGSLVSSHPPHFVLWMVGNTKKEIREMEIVVLFSPISVLSKYV
jgi:hypothetical protein